MSDPAAGLHPGPRLLGRGPGCFGAAILAAPFLAFALHPNLGLLATALALLALAWLALTVPVPDRAQRRRVRAVAALNAALALACLGLLVARLAAG